MKRAHQSVPPALPIRLDGGHTLRVNAVSGTCVNVEAARGEPVVIRGVPLHGNENFMRQDDGSWKPYSEISRHSARFSRTDRDMFQNEATPAMNKSVMALMTEAVGVFLRDHPEELPKAEASARNNQIMRLDNEIEEASKKLDDLIVKRNEVRRKEAAALQAMQEFDGPEESDGPRP